MYICECFSLEHVEDQYYPIGTPVVCICNCSISLLSGGVPNLKFNLFFHVSYASKPKIDPDSGYVVLIEFIICEPHQETGFAYTRVPQEYDLEKVIIFFPRHVFLSIRNI